MSFTRQCAVPVHPRLRGELATDTVSVTGGSSPLTRGTLLEWERVDPFNRFIPAYAGNSVERTIHDCQDTVHPRLRGELTFAVNARASGTGSSPLTRGTQVV